MIKRVCKKEISVPFVLYLIVLKYLVKNRESTFTFCLYWLNIGSPLKEKEFQQINWNLELKDKDDKKLSWKSAYCDGVSLVLDGYRYNYGFRDYDPVQMRFTTVDHVKNGPNWYSYVNNDPVNMVDPTGLAEIYADDIHGNPILAWQGRDLKADTSIAIKRSSADSYYNDTLSVKIGNQTIYKANVQSEADWPGYELDTIPTGVYVGTLLDYTGSYDDPISLENKELGVNADDYTLIHPNEFTNQTKIDQYVKEEKNTGPWDQPYSQNCQITDSKTAYDRIHDQLTAVGYEYKGYIGADGEYYGNPDKITVTIKNK